MCGSAIKKITNIVKKVDPLRGGDVLLDKMGLPSLMGEKNGIFNTPEQAAIATAESTGSTAPTAAPTTSSDSVQSAVEAERRRRLAQSGQNSTMLTGASGVLGSASTSQKTLLGV